MNAIVIGHPEAHEKLTARLFWKGRTESGYLDSGDVQEYGEATTRSLVTRARSEHGNRQVNAEQADTNQEAYSFLLDERVPEQELLIKQARRLPNFAQPQNEGVTATVSNVAPGRTYFFGSYNVANTTVTASRSGQLEEGQDYDLDAPNGNIKVTQKAQISVGEDLHLTFDEPCISMEQHESQAQPLFYCDIVLLEHNQFSKMWLRKLTFTANLNVTEFPQHTGQYGHYRVKATAAGPVNILKRPEGATLPIFKATTEPAGNSSSSSSSSTSSQSSSSSSSSKSSQSSSSSSTFTSKTSSSSSLLSQTTSESQSSPSSWSSHSSASSVNSSSSTFTSHTSSSSSHSSPSSFH